MTVVISHTDIDGYASAVIVIMALGEDTRFMPINYGWKPIDFGKFANNERIVMTDFTASLDEMKKLKSDYRFTWIDHHQTTSDPIEAIIGKDTDGIRQNGTAACIHTWNHFFPNKPIPHPLKVMGAYDIGDTKTYPETKALQKVLYDIDVFPIGVGKLSLWKRILFEQEYYDQLLARGNMLLDIQNKEYSAKNRYMIEPIDFHGLRGIAANYPMQDIDIFSSAIDPDRHDVVVGYYKYFKTNQDGSITNYWKFSVRAVRDDLGVDLGALCKKYYKHGGGHANSAGGSVKYLSDLKFISNVCRCSKYRF